MMAGVRMVLTSVCLASAFSENERLGKVPSLV